MKKLFIVLVLMTSAASALASSQLMTSSTEINYSIEKASTEEMSELKESAANTCYAYTTCRNGYTISCKTYGQACTWYVSYQSYVSCTGYNQFGDWVTATASCY